MRSLNFIGRLNSTLLSDAEWNATSPDVLIFGTADFSHILPIWVERTRNFGGRLHRCRGVRGDALRGSGWSSLVGGIGHWLTGAVHSRLSGGDRYIDCRPSLLEPLIRMGALREIRMKSALEPSLIPVNREWLEKLQSACSEQLYRFVDRRPEQIDPSQEWADSLFDEDQSVEETTTFAASLTKDLNRNACVL